MQFGINLEKAIATCGDFDFEETFQIHPVLEEARASQTQAIDPNKELIRRP